MRFKLEGLWATCRQIVMMMPLVGAWLAGAACSKNNEIERAPELLGRDREMIIHRTDGGRTATVQFFTRFPAYCKVEFWPTKLGDNPSPDRKRAKRCFHRTPGQSHFVRLEGLRSNQPLYVRLLASSSNRKVQSYDDVMVLKETTTGYSYFPPSEDARGESDSHLNVTVIKANLTQASASVYSHLVPEDDYDDEMRLFTTINEGCQKYDIAHPSSLMPPHDLDIKGVSSSGYYSTKGVEIDKGRGVFLLEFTGKVASAQHWFFKFIFSRGSSDHNSHEVVHKFSVPPELRSVEMVSPEEVKLRIHDLVTFPQSLELAKGDGLEFEWDAKYLSEGDYFEILIGKPSAGAAVKCRYAATAQRLEVSAGDLPSIVNRPTDVIVSINRRGVSQVKGGHVMFLHSHDWRHLSVMWR